MTNYNSMLEACRAASSAIHGENLEVDYHGSDAKLQALYFTVLKVQLSIDGTAFKFTSKDRNNRASLECTINAPEDYATMTKPTAEPLPESIFTNPFDYVHKREIKKIYDEHPFATIRYVMNKLHIPKD